MKVGGYIFPKVCMIAILSLVYYTGRTSADTWHGADFINTTTPIGDNYYVGGSNIVIDTKVDKDVWALASTINIGGTIGQDTTIIGNYIMIRGDIGGDLRIIGNNVSIFGNISGDVVIIASSIELGNDVIIEGTVRLYAASVLYNAESKNTVSINTSNLIYNGQSLKGADITTQQLTIQQNAQIIGNLKYRTPQKNTKLESIVQQGTVDYDLSLQKTNIIGLQYTLYSGYFVRWLCFVLVMSLIGHKVLYSFFHRISNTLQAYQITSFLRGCVFIITTPLMIGLLGFTIIGLPIAIILLMIYIIILSIYQIGLIIVGTHLIGSYYFPSTSFKDQFANICIIISLSGIIVALGRRSLIPGLFIIGASCKTIMKL